MNREALSNKNSIVFYGEVKSKDFFFDCLKKGKIYLGFDGSLEKTKSILKEINRVDLKGLFDRRRKYLFALVNFF